MRKSVKSHGNSSRLKQVGANSFFGAIIGALCLIILLAIFSALCTSLPDPHPLVAPLSIFSMLSSAFFCGFSAVKRNKSSDALLCGALSGAILLSLLMLCFGFVGGEDSSPTATLICRLLFVPLSLVGGFCGLGRKKKQGRKRKF